MDFFTDILVTKRTTPLYSHDCEQCKFRGSLVEVNNRGVARTVDVYVCHDGDGIVRRLSSEPADYEAFPRRIVKMLIGHTRIEGGEDEWLHSLRLAETASLIRPKRFNAVGRGTNAELDEPFFIVRWGRIYTSEEGDTRVGFWVIQLTDDAAKHNDPKVWLHNFFPSSRSTSEYDCTGQWYASRAKISRLPNGQYLIRQSEHLDV